MKKAPVFSAQFVEQELNRINSRPLASFIDGSAQAVEEKIATTSLPPLAEKFPCPCCKGAGWLYTAQDLFSLDLATGKLEPITRKSGGNVRVSGSLPCPYCWGAQFDMKAFVGSQMEAQGVAA